MVNGGAAQVYGDKTYAREAGTLTDGNNSFDVSATSSAGIQDTANLMVNLPATVTPLYDANGNLISGGGRSFEYDDENQLKAVQVAGAWRSEFVYDGFGRMRKCIEKTWNGTAFVQGSETRYIYDGMRVIQERDENNNPLVTYTRGLDLSGSLGGAGGIGGLLARTDASGTAYYHSDLGGNVTAVAKEIVDQLGAHSHVLVAKYLYDPYGNILGQWGPLAEANNYRFSSKEFHANSGLYYYGYRFYEPNLQRWMNRDPSGEAGGLNLYGLVGNSPVGRIDPLGLHWTDYIPDWIGGLFEYEAEDYLSASGMLSKGVPTVVPEALRGNLRLLQDQLGDYDGSQLQNLATGMRFAAELNPIVGGINSGYTACSGKDSISHEEVGTATRVQAGAGVGAIILGATSGGIKYVSKIDRAAFKAEREAFWIAEAESNAALYISDRIASLGSNAAGRSDANDENGSPSW